MSKAKVEILTDWNEQIVLIENAAAIMPWSRSNLRSCFSSGYQNFAAKTADGNIVGFIIVQQQLRDEWTIMDVAVDPNFQRQGIGYQLVTQVTMAADLVQAEIILEVRESNQAAQHLYKQSGFNQIGERKEYYPNPDGSRETAVVMSRKPQSTLSR
ncbi:ribosomal protein S18-alanine N-acetyltransferase [Pseudidiomarina woesei]|uniref:[Ribosomal protein bS18]-alanine N-acetyltransferase n=1 Tax=Pseudidiomarina woesei TaxID=1381080 RepID=A0A0K6HBE2_9GAMM|nr:ribosomal protein S18-alanine N-acetyltransferase [Pseudidiomarina woesei]CUA88324.1 ribosomal-protein-alanine acetyltransferase [Pseudidiomarina woesei]